MFGFHFIKVIAFHYMNTLRHQNIPCRSLDMLLSRCGPVEAKASPDCNSPRDAVVFVRICVGGVLCSDLAAS
jgi:hypothetical protein